MLNNERININDNFFDIGEQSLKAIELISQINLQWNVHLALDTIFKSPTIKMLLQYNYS